MKTVYTLVSMLFVCVVLHAQIPNSGFENWSGGLPTGWWGQNVPDTLFVQSHNAHSGNSALRMNVSNMGGIASGGYLYTGDSLDYNFPISSPPGALYGWYIGHIVTTGDMLTVNSTIYTGIYALGINQSAGISQPSSVYKQFIINYAYGIGTNQGNDSAEIEFGIQNQTDSFLNPNTYFILDDLSFGDSVSTAGVNPVIANAALEQCIPNPTSGNVNVIYTLSENSTSSVALYDLMGRQVKLLLSDTKQTTGRYKIPTDVSDLPGGVYICRLNANGQFYDNKLMVAK
jgi:hypothetical protein